MSKEINTGGMAFPGVEHLSGCGCSKKTADGDWEVHQEGMTLRDYFAGQSLAGMLSNSLTQGGVCDHKLSNHDNVKNAAEAVILHNCGVAYIYADAMIAEREKGGSVTNEAEEVSVPRQHQVHSFTESPVEGGSCSVCGNWENHPVHGGGAQ